MVDCCKPTLCAMFFQAQKPQWYGSYVVDEMQVFSFKLRGAYNMMAKLPQEQLDRGVICSSAGNHAQGVALAARRLKCDAVIAMPVTTPEIKVSQHRLPLFFSSTGLFDNISESEI